MMLFTLSMTAVLPVRFGGLGRTGGGGARANPVLFAERHSATTRLGLPKPRY